MVSKSREELTTLLAVLEERISRMRDEDLTRLHNDLVDFRTAANSKLEAIDTKLDENRVRTIAVLGGLIVSIALFVANLIVKI